MLPADELGSDGHYLGGGSECIPSDRRKLGRERDRRVEGEGEGGHREYEAPSLKECCKMDSHRTSLIHR